MTSGVAAPGFTGGTLDRADRLRHDPDGLAAAKSDWRARLLKLNAFEPEVDGNGRLGWTNLADAPDDAEVVLLGLDDGCPCFAARRPGERAPGRTASLFRAIGSLRSADAAIYAAARSLLDWHGRHGFCANCAAPTRLFRAGWGRTCETCGTEHFPRVDPVVIMLAEHGSRVLLGRQPAYPPNRYSALAGFLELGESIEEAVAREMFEEAGVRVGNVRYIASQPWPFPGSLMIACIADAEDDTIILDENELEDAIWVSREDVRTVLAGKDGPFLPPPPYAIAFTLLTEWARG